MRWSCIALLLTLSATTTLRAEEASSDTCVVEGLVTQDGLPRAAAIELRWLAQAETHLSRWRAMMGEPSSASLDPVIEHRTTSTPDGRFVIEGLPPGIYAVDARTGTGHHTVRAVICHLPGVRRFVRLVLRRAHPIEGRVTWEDGQAARGEVQIVRAAQGGFAYSGPDDPWGHVRDCLPEVVMASSQLDPDGAFRVLPIEPGRYILRTKYDDDPGIDGELSSSTPFEIEPHHAPRRMTLRFSKPRSRLQGRVLDKRTKEPIPGAVVRCAHPSHPKPHVAAVTTTNEQGRFSISVDDRRTCAVISAAGYWPASVKATPLEHPILLTPEPGASTLSLSPSRIEGRVLDSSGSPAPGARVLALFRVGRYFCSIRQTYADGSGHFALNDLRGQPTQWMIFVFGGGWHGPDLATYWKLHPRRGATHVTLRAVRSPRFDGVILDHAGSPVQGALIRSRSLTFPTRASTVHNPVLRRTVERSRVSVSDAEGRFSVADAVPELPYGLSVEAPGHAPMRLPPLTLPKEGTSIQVALPAPRTLSVDLVDTGTGAPVRGAEVRLSPPDLWTWRMAHAGIWTAESGASGRVLFTPLAPSEHTLRVKAPGYATVEQKLDLGTGPHERTIRVALEAAASFSGYVRDLDGSKVSNARVFVRDPELPHRVVLSTTTDVHGRFEAHGLSARTYEVGVAEEGDRRPAQFVEVTPPVSDVELRLYPEGSQRKTLKVHLSGPTGAPIPVASVKGKIGSRPFHTSLENGRARIPHVFVPGSRRDAEVSLEISGARTRDGTFLALASVSWSGPWPANDIVKLTLDPTAPITGRVVDSKGEPIALVRVVARSTRPGTQANARAYTKRDGSFALHDLPEGSYLLTVKGGQNFAPMVPVEVFAPRAGVELRLRRGRRIEVGVVDADGEAVARAYVSLRGMAQGEDAMQPVLYRSARTRNDGTAILAGLPAEPGPLELSVDPPETARGTLQPLVVTDWTPDTTVLRLKPAMVIEGRVLDAAGHPVNGARLHLAGETRLIRYANTRKGRFRFWSLPPGAYVLTVQARKDRRDWEDPGLTRVRIDKNQADLVLRLPK